MKRFFLKMNPWKSVRNTQSVKKATKLSLVLSLILAGFVLACGTRWQRDTGGKTNITLWYSLGGRYSRPMLNIVEQFNAMQDSIFVETSYQGNYGPAFQKILASVVAENPPTLAQVVVQLGPRLVEYGTVASLEPFFAADSAFTKSAFFPQLLKSCTFDGDLYALPMNASTQVLYYNKDLFRAAGLDPEAPPQTWQEVYRYAQKLAQLNVRLADGREVQVIGLRLDMIEWDVERIIYGWGGRVYKDDFSRVAYRSDAVLESLRFLRKMVDEGLATARGSNESDITGIVGMVLRSTGSLEYLKEHVNYELGVAPQPVAKQAAIPLGGGNLFLFADASPRQKRAAWAFLRYLYSPQNQLLWSSETGYMTSIRSAYESDAMQQLFAEDARRRVTYEQLPSTISSPKHGSYKEINDELRRFFNDVLQQNMSPEAALLELETRGNKIIQNYY